MARILSIEDDGELQKSLSLALTAAGYDVHYAFTGREGYERALALLPDLVICDMMLPAMSGPELVTRLKEHKPLRDTPIIVTTAYFDAPRLMERRLRALGAVEYLKKPLSLEDVVRAAKRLCPTGLRPGTARLPARGRLRLDPLLQTVWWDDRLLGTLGPKRFAALRLLFQASGPVDRETLMRSLWGCSAPARLDKTIQRLREALGPAGTLVRTTEAGYVLLTDADSG